jgi:RNA polymerase sigma-70 factor, ECF subfamily
VKDAALSEALARLRQSKDDEGAWRALYAGLRPLVQVVLRRTGIREPSLEDVTQEVFVRLAMYCRFEAVADPAAFRAYLVRVVVNASKDHRQRLLRRPAVDVNRRIESEASVGSSGSEADKELKSALAGLDERDRTLLRMKIDGFSAAEIGSALHMTVGNVYVRIHRIRAELAKTLKSKS